MNAAELELLIRRAQTGNELHKAAAAAGSLTMAERGALQLLFWAKFQALFPRKGRR